MWLYVFDCLTKPQDIYNVRDASPYFRKILQSKLNLVQFPAVLEQLVKNVYDKPSAMMYEATEQLLKMRTICKSWKEAADTKLIIEDKFSIKDPDEVSKAERFLRHFAVTHEPQRKNPFLTQYVTIAHDPMQWEGDKKWQEIMERDARCFNAIQTILSVYGTHIWGFCLEARRPLSFQQFDRLYKLMELTPNLKLFHVSINCSQFTKEQLEQVNFPEIPSLESLFVFVFPKENYTVDRLIIRSLFDRYNHITYLTVIKFSDLSTADFPNLKYLEIRDPISAEQIQELEQPRLNWALESLTLTFALGDSQQPVQVVDLIGRKWGRTLNDLMLIFNDNDRNCSKILEKRFSFDLADPAEFPLLESLSIVFQMYGSWGFISKSMKNIKHLTLNYCLWMNFRRDRDTEKLAAKYESVDKWMMALLNPLEADFIWETFPKLETLRCWRNCSFQNIFSQPAEMETFTRVEWKEKK